ncbi:MAG TPA: phosphoserine phosphatase SerB [Polyangiaceae bacterium]
MQAQHPDRIVLHIAGADRPGVTARLTEIIAEESAGLVDIGQSVLHGYLMLSAIVDIPTTSNAFRKILFAAADLGLRLEVSPYRTERERAFSDTALAVTVLGPLGDGRAPADITRFMAERGMNIREIRSISDAELSGLELIVDLPAGTPPAGDGLSELRGKLLALGMQLGVDLAVQKDDIFRKSKRLVCMDVDSTFVKGELIDELAGLAGVKEQVSTITARAMRGELDFQQALAERVKLLEGLPFEQAKALADRSVLTPGADRFVRVLQGLGYRIGLVSGGFTFFVDDLKQRYGLDFAFSNELEVMDGKLTGRVRGSVVDGQRKSQVLRDMAQAYHLRLGQTVAVGDGANDVLMLQTAGLGIAFRAKPKLQEVAHFSLNHHERLDTLLYLMGYNARDLREAEDQANSQRPPSVAPRA